MQRKLALRTVDRMRGIVRLRWEMGAVSRRSVGRVSAVVGLQLRSTGSSSVVVGLVLLGSHDWTLCRNLLWVSVIRLRRGRIGSVVLVLCSGNCVVLGLVQGDNCVGTGGDVGLFD